MREVELGESFRVAFALIALFCASSGRGKLQISYGLGEFVLQKLCSWAFILACIHSCLLSFIEAGVPECSLLALEHTDILE